MSNTKKELEARMSKSIVALHSELNKIRTGRAHPDLLDHIHVDYYGTQTPLNQVCSISVENATTLLLNIWEKPLVGLVEKSILESDLSLNPVVNGTLVRIPMPPLTEERRKDLFKIVRQQGENTKVAIRNIRRDFNQHLKSDLKKKEISKDEEKRLEAEVQKVTDANIKEVDDILVAKEQELMEI